MLWAAEEASGGGRGGEGWEEGGGQGWARASRWVMIDGMLVFMGWGREVGATC